MMTIQKPFRAAVRHEEGTATIKLFGEINNLAAGALDAAYATAQENSPQKIMLNFGEVSYINSTGIALIVGLLAQARSNHIELVTFGLSDHYVEIFQITRLSDFMTIVPDEATARIQES